jgi:hypothetical protein
MDILTSRDQPLASNASLKNSCGKLSSDRDAALDIAYAL